MSTNIASDADGMTESMEERNKLNIPHPSLPLSHLACADVTLVCIPSASLYAFPIRLVPPDFPLYHLVASSPSLVASCFTLLWGCYCRSVHKHKVRLESFNLPKTLPPILWQRSTPFYLVWPCVSSATLKTLSCGLYWGEGGGHCSFSILIH